MSGVVENLISPRQLRQAWEDAYRNGASQFHLDIIKAAMQESDNALTAWSATVLGSLSEDANRIGTMAHDDFEAIETDAVLIADALRAGRIETAEARHQLDMLRARLNQQSERRLAFLSMAARIEEIEADPLGTALKAAETNRGLWVRVPW